ncbi:MAG: PLP-dependent cysteine synthase family protein [Candidatus Zixiibacteriota bacterium]
MFYEDVSQLVGNTPLVKLKRVIQDIKALVLAKLEFLNPGGSVKDRMAFYMLKEAEKSGQLRPGGTIVEATSGNTGVAVAMYAAIRGYQAIFTIPDKMSKEKIDLLKAFGAEVIITPTEVPPASPQSYYEVAKRIHSETPNSYFVGQYQNLKNPEAHYQTTGPEIWEQTQGKIDYLVGGVGTGGTMSGACKFLKEKKPEIKTIAVDPLGSVFYDYFKTKKLIEPHLYLVEGIGEDMLVETMQFDFIDDFIQVTDKDSFLMARRLAKEEGIFAGGSSGAALWATLQVAKDLDQDKMVVVILPDTGARYLSKIYNDDWMKEKGFL